MSEGWPTESTDLTEYAADEFDKYGNLYGDDHRLLGLQKRLSSFSYDAWDQSPNRSKAWEGAADLKAWAEARASGEARENAEDPDYVPPEPIAPTVKPNDLVPMERKLALKYLARDRITDRDEVCKALTQEQKSFAFRRGSNALSIPVMAAVTNRYEKSEQDLRNRIAQYDELQAQHAALTSLSDVRRTGAARKTDRMLKTVTQLETDLAGELDGEGAFLKQKRVMTEQITIIQQSVVWLKTRTSDSRSLDPNTYIDPVLR